MTQINIPDNLLGIPTNLFGGGLFGAIFTFIFSRKRQAAEVHKIEAEGGAAMGSMLNEQTKLILDAQAKHIDAQKEQIEAQSRSIASLMNDVTRLSAENVALTEEVHALWVKVDKLQKSLAQKSPYDTIIGQ